MSTESEHRAEMRYELNKTYDINVSRAKELHYKGWSTIDVACVLEASNNQVRAWLRNTTIEWCLDHNMAMSECPHHE